MPDGNLRKNPDSIDHTAAFDEHAEASGEDDLEWLKAWWKRYEDAQRTSTRTIRFSSDEWKRVEEQAAVAEIPSSTFMRVISLAERPDQKVNECTLLDFCSVICRLLDLVLRNPTGLTHLAEAHHLRMQLEAAHQSLCYNRHRDEGYDSPVGIVESRLSETLRRRLKEGDQQWLNGHELDQETLRTVMKTVRFKEEEWARVETRARRAGIAPALFVRLISLGARPDQAGNIRALGIFCDLSRKAQVLLDRNADSITHLAEAQELAKRLDEMMDVACSSVASASQSA